MSVETITAVELGELIAQKRVAILDVREDEEIAISKIENSLHIPLMSLKERITEWEEFSADKDVSVVICRSGVRSQKAIEMLESSGLKHCKNLVGGINSYATEVDNSLEVY